MNDQSKDTTTNETAPAQEKQGSNTLMIVLAVLLVLALAAVAFLLINYVIGEDSGTGDEIFQPTAAPEEPANLPLEGTQWYLVGALEGTSISLVFAGDSVSGFAGCNNYNSTYRSTRAGGSSNDISIGSISSGQAICDEPIMNQEQDYLATLPSVNRFTINGSTLTLNTRVGTLTFGAAQATQ